MATNGTGAYGANDKLVDYILGITFEIWEQRKVDLIHQYYDADIVVYALDGITRGALSLIHISEPTRLKTRSRMTSCA